MTTFGHDLVWWFVISTSDLSMVDHARTRQQDQSNMLNHVENLNLNYFRVRDP